MAAGNRQPSATGNVLRHVIEAWALVGGVVLIGVVLVNAFSLSSLILAGRPFPGDFEIVEVGVAVSVFCFLPYCQVTGANVTADIFTSGAGPRTLAVLSTAASIVASAFAVFLLWRMYEGFLDFRLYEETTAIYQFPIWIAYVPILVSIALLIVASLMSLADALAGRATQESAEL
ncbi:TRAP transporter small permease [uncultured Nitratireductor sp.]|uniref:TRAP transporter small permease n=1 Tax=uncultured Nitratireductor sp. TaxID=520953 RepID=UPI0025F0E92B|nr:TRAP transporter small permease [uncultured Nitratireductor sp.]